MSGASTDASVAFSTTLSGCGRASLSSSRTFLGVYLRAVGAVDVRTAADPRGPRAA